MAHESPKINGDGSYSRDFTYIDNVIQANQLAAITPSDIIRERQKLYEARLSDSVRPGLEEQSELKDIGRTNPDINREEDTTKRPHAPRTEAALSEVFNIAYGQRTSLNQLAQILKDNLSKFDPEIANVVFKYGATRAGDVPHYLASIEKGKTILNYNPEYSVKQGLEEACEWYWENLK
jgi:UDP-N-acetylglucosamine 4-epimerase